MGQLLTLPVKKRRIGSRKWSLPAFQQRTHQLQEAIQALSLALGNEYKLLKRRKHVDSQQYATILQAVRELRQRTDTWSTVMYDEERLPFAVRTRRFSHWSASYHVLQRTDEIIHLLTASCTVYGTGTPSYEETALRQDIIHALAALLESGRELLREMTVLLDQIRFGQEPPA